MNRGGNQPPAPGKAIKLLTLLEAKNVTGVARNMLDFCQAVRELNQRAPGSLPIETTLVTFNRLQPGGGEELPNGFIRIARERGEALEVIPERFRFDLKVVSELRRIVEQHAPDVVATHNLKSHFLMRFSGLHRRFPWVAFHHGYTTTDFKMRIYNQLNRWSLPAADRVVTVCQAFAKQLVREGVRHERISARHNAVGAKQRAGTEEARALRTSLGIQDGERLVLAIGRLSREKAHLDLVEAFALMRRSHPEINAKLLIVGGGAEREAVEASIRQLGIADRAQLTGHLGDVWPYYAAADVFVLPSHSEGSPYVLLEAMTSGVPVVATAVGGVPEMVADDETALLVSPEDPPAMAHAIARILGDREIAVQLTARASALVATRYSPEAYVRSLLEIYREVVARRARR